MWFLVAPLVVLSAEVDQPPGSSALFSPQLEKSLTQSPIQEPVATYQVTHLKYSVTWFFEGHQQRWHIQFKEADVSTLNPRPSLKDIVRGFVDEISYELLRSGEHERWSLYREHLFAALSMIEEQQGWQFKTPNHLGEWSEISDSDARSPQHEYYVLSFQSPQQLIAGSPISTSEN